VTPFYTGRGDSGKTGFLGEGRISKSSARIEAVGSVDEASAALGFARALTENKSVQEMILQVQKHLYLLMAELSADSKTADQFDLIHQSEVDWLEGQILELENNLTMPKEFILPGESPASAALAVARTIVRRAERRAIALFEMEGFKKEVLIAYLNRLSSLVFILEIYETSLYDQHLRLAKEE
jgi:cob(I)alamin adenosyltransferase